MDRLAVLVIRAEKNQTTTTSCRKLRSSLSSFPVVMYRSTCELVGTSEIMVENFATYMIKNQLGEVHREGWC